MLTFIQPNSVGPASVIHLKREPMNAIWKLTEHVASVFVPAESFFLGMARK